MSTSPVLPQPSGPLSDDIFEQLLQASKLLTARELSGIITIKPKTLYSYAAQGLIPHYKIESNVRFRGREIADWLRDHARQKPTPIRVAERERANAPRGDSGSQLP